MEIKGIKCNKCNDFIYSRCEHDFHYCSCKACAIDGGQSVYYRIIGNPKDYSFDTIELDVTKKELYDDWNYCVDKYGIIKNTCI